VAADAGDCTRAMLDEIEPIPLTNRSNTKYYGG
jgi:hypothetical protein